MADGVQEEVPVTLLTGFLGSGKTTLLGRALRDPRLGITAILVNELGDVPLDHDLVVARDEALIRTTTGCLCCTLRGDIRAALSDLWIRRASGVLPRFERVIVETTGLADPAPAIHTLMSDQFITRNYWLGGVVTTIDSVNGASTLDRHYESRRQVAVADRIVLTKRDLLEGPPPRALSDRIASLNRGAPVLPADDPARLVEAVRRGRLRSPHSAPGGGTLARRPSRDRRK